MVVDKPSSSIVTLTGYNSTGSALPFHVATPTTSDNSATPEILRLAAWSSSTRPIWRSAALSTPVSRNNESNRTWPEANSWAMPEGWAWVISSFAAS